MSKIKEEGVSCSDPGTVCFRTFFCLALTAIAPRDDAPLARRRVFLM